MSMQTMEHLAVFDPLVQEVTFARVDSAFTRDTALRIKEQLSPVFQRPGPVVLDIAAADVDSVGLGAMLSMQRRLELQGRRLLVVSDDPAFHTLLERAEVVHCLTLFPHADAAVAYAQRPECTPS
jgi:anti-anti-sigma regulatory factor